jgi:hypothetical protein
MGLGRAGTAQEPVTHLSITPIHYESLFKHDGFAPIALMVSLHHHMRPELGTALEAHVLWRSVFNLAPMEAQDYHRLSYQGWQASYRRNTREWGITYRTLFYYLGGVGSGLYVGSSIGFRHVERSIDVENVSGTSYGTSPFRDLYNAKTWLFPVGLRAGIGAIDPRTGGFVDLYFGISYQFGSNRNLFDEPEMAEAPAIPAPITYTLGMTFMIGL